MPRRKTSCLLLLLALACSPVFAQTGVELTSGGPIAFAPNGVLLVSDPMEATVYAFETRDTNAVDAAEFQVDDIRGKVAGMLGVTADEARINDLAVNPISKNIYLSVSRGAGASQFNAILIVNPGTGEVSEFDMQSKFTKATLPNAAESRQTRRGNQRQSSITDMAYIDEQIYIAGLSNEEFASNLRSIPFPFQDVSKGSSIEIYHAAHGQFETRSPVRTFAAYEVDGETNLLAAYTCTPLVRIPLGVLQPGTKVKGTTIAELGNRNRPLDMVVYKKDGKDYVLMANSSRGVMKIDLSTISEQEGIITPVRGGGTAGLTYETIESLKGVKQLDGFGPQHAVILVADDKGKEMLKSIELM